jgi:tRNA(adenine34) deaminase
MFQYKFMDEAIKYAKKAAEKNYVPIGCVFIKNGEIISAQYNQEFWHAEILCLIETIEKYGRYLNEVSVYVTAKPCKMCQHALSLAKVGKIIYGTTPKQCDYHNVEIIGGIKEDVCSDLLSNFFTDKR